MRGQKNMAKLPYSAQTGWSLVSHISEWVSAAFQNWACERPPRPLHQLLRLRAIALALRGWLRDFFLMSQPPLLGEEGNGIHLRG
jgi:hypothetical protein